MSHVPAEAPSNETAPAATPSLDKSAGVRSLIRGNRPPAPSKSTRSVKSAVPRWYLFGGDLLLVALALIIVYKSPTPLNWQRVLFCSLVVVLGAILAIIALGAGESSSEPGQPKPSPFSGRK